MPCGSVPCHDATRRDLTSPHLTPHTSHLTPHTSPDRVEDVDEGVTADEVAVEEADASHALTSGQLDKSSKISFPIPGTLKGHSSSKPVMELKNVYFAYDEEEGPMILNDISCKISMNSRVGITGRNGAGKSTLLNLLCGELVPTPKPGGGSTLGDVFKHRNLRLAYIAQQHMFHLQEFMNSTPYTYIQRRFQHGWDEALQRRLLEPENEEEANTRKELASKYGKYGNEVEKVLSRVVKNNELFYEIQWKGLDDPKSNTLEPLTKLKKMGVTSFAHAYDERLASQAAGIDQRPLSQKEIVKHMEQFGLDEDMVMNREIGGFSAGDDAGTYSTCTSWYGAVQTCQHRTASHPALVSRGSTCKAWRDHGGRPAQARCPGQPMLPCRISRVPRLDRSSSARNSGSDPGSAARSKLGPRDLRRGLPLAAPSARSEHTHTHTHTRAGSRTEHRPSPVPPRRDCNHPKVMIGVMTSPDRDTESARRL